MPTTDDRTFLTGLIGTGIGASLTPAMHEHEADAQGLRQVYQIIDLASLGLGVDALPDLLTFAQRFGFTGLNITHPCKQAVIPLLDELSPHAKALGAVNTVLFQGGRRVGHNTDWSGYAEAFRRGLPGADLSRVVQLGAGGAGGAVAYAALTLGVQNLAIHDIDPARAEAVAASLCATFGEGRARVVGDLRQDVASATGLINTSPVGMAKYPGTPLPVEWLHPGLFVSEIIYFPLETALLRAAREIGCATLNGGGMAVFQAVDAFRLFTGAEPDAERMRRHFAALTSHRQAG
jgi:shikimate dehydrogenase